MNNFSLFLNNINDLTEAQKASFYNFLYKGINNELEQFINPLPITIRQNKKKIISLLYLFLNEVKIKGPFLTINDCRNRELTYSIQIYIKGEYSYFLKKNKQKNLLTKAIRVKQDIYLAEIPFMTEEGTFFINGCERVIINQIIRSPGIYFRKEFNNINQIIYTATIISNKGLWTKICFDELTIHNKKNIKKNFFPTEHIYIQLYNSKNFNKEINDFIQKLPLLEIIKYFGLTIEEILDTVNHKNLLINNNLLTFLKNEEVKEINSLIIRNLFFNQKICSFSIGHIGRYKFNKKLNLNLPLKITYLTAHDFLAIIDKLIELKYENLINDDIDDLKNKQIRCVGELLENQFRIGLLRLKQNISYEEIEEFNEEKILKKTFNNLIKKQFDIKKNQIYLDKEFFNSKFITSSINEFFKTSQLSQFMDQTNPLAEITHKRRISLFGPNGLKRDNISNIIRDIHPSQYGRLCPIETPEGQNAGLISSLTLYARINKYGGIETPFFKLQKEKIENKKIPSYLNPEDEFKNVIAFSDIKFIKNYKKYISGKEQHLFVIKKLSDIKYLAISSLQILSLATSLIPFVEHNDANRALMGSNMQRQAVPLLFSQKPLIGTGLESISIIDSEMIIKSYSEGIVNFSSVEKIQIFDKKNQKINYLLKKYKRSNQNTAINQKPIVWIGEKIYSGQIIADGPGTNNGELALGYNLIVAYMPWEGYNYEDAIIINEKIVTNNYLTSIHIEECNLDLTDYFLGKDILTNEIPNFSPFKSNYLNLNGIIKIGSYIKSQDILIGKLTPTNEELSPELKIFKAIYGKIKTSYQNTSLYVPNGIEGRVIDIRLLLMNIKNEKNNKQLLFSKIIRIFIAQIKKIQVGDKISGRHGNKGIISKILTNQDMPFLPDGTSIDILLNPLGVPSRMNVGQILECLLGFAANKLEKRFNISPFDEIYGEESSRILINQKLKEAKIKKKINWLFNSNYPGKILIRDGRTGENFDNPITIGKSYILKLIHIVEDKIHARSVGPYSMITEQPLAGKSQEGGQRFGEMEVWALEGYGCAYLLQELLTIKSDDIDGRNDMYSNILEFQKKKELVPSIPESFLALMRELNSLGLDFRFRNFISNFLDTNFLTEIEPFLFENIEKRLKLRALLIKKQLEIFSNTIISTNSIKNFQKFKEKQKKKIESFFQKI